MSADRTTNADRAEADGYERIHWRHVEPGDVVRLHRGAPDWHVDQVRRVDSRRYRITGWTDDGEWMDMTSDGRIDCRC